MLPILLGITSVLFDSIGKSFWKVSLNLTDLSNNLFKLFGTIGNALLIPFILVFSGFLSNSIPLYIIPLVFFISLCWYLNSQLWLKILKEEKLSSLLPYDDLDKILTVIIGFFLFQQTDSAVSIQTFIITLITISFVIVFSLDFKKLVFPKSILLVFLNKIFRSILILTVSFILLKVSSGDYFIIKLSFEIVIVIVVAFLIGDKFSDMMTQSKKFYINRSVPAFLGGITYLMSLYIIETSGIIIATLLGFIGIVFNILSMKFIAKDSASSKQILLSFIVILLISIGYILK